DLLHGNTARYGTNQRAQIATHALIFDNARYVLGDFAIAQVATRTLGCGDALMRAVFAGDVAKIATDAELRIDFGDDLVIQIQIAPIADSLSRATDVFHSRGETFLAEVLRETVDHVFHDPEAVVHGRRANLNRGGAQQHELRGIAPVTHATDARNRNSYFGMFGDGRNHV